MLEQHRQTVVLPHHANQPVRMPTARLPRLLQGKCVQNHLDCHVKFHLSRSCSSIGNSLSAGITAAVVIGSILGFIICIVLPIVIVCCICYKKRSYPGMVLSSNQQQSRYAAPIHNPNQSWQPPPYYPPQPSAPISNQEYPPKY
jgi:hypothetical protein